MVGSYRRLTPGSFHGFFSTGVGVFTVDFVHRHQLGPLVTIHAIWLASMYFIHVRAQSGRGQFLGTNVRVYYGFGVALYIFGVLLAALLCTLTG